MKGRRVEVQGFGEERELQLTSTLAIIALALEHHVTLAHHDEAFSLVQTLRLRRVETLPQLHGSREN